MSIKVEELTSEVIGRKLGKNLYNSQGNLLLRRGVEINSNYFSHFVDKGYRSIYLIDSEKEVDVQEFEEDSNRLLATSSHILKKTFMKLMRTEYGNSLNGKREITVLADSILSDISSNIQKIPHLLELKTPADYLYQHSINVAIHSILIGKKLLYDDKKLFNLVVSALLHDFGMLFIDEQLVNKASNLEEREFEKIKEHTIKGFEHLVRNCSFDGLATIASVQHHERYDGKGYPKNLAGDLIHEFSRIITLTDFFDALTSDRPHRRMNSVADAVKYIKEKESTTFDPDLVKIFSSTIE